MSKPYVHALSSVKKFGGKVEDYLPIHNLLDSSKGAVPSSVHRALTHTSWFLSVILEKIFGFTIINSDGKVISTRDVGEQHILEDFKGKFIPTAQDYLQQIEFQDWMQNGEKGYPPSYQKLVMPKKSTKTFNVEEWLKPEEVTYDTPKIPNFPILPNFKDKLID